MFSKLKMFFVPKTELQTVMTVICCLLTSMLVCTPESLRATTWSCTNAGFEIDSPDDWAGAISSSKTSVELESAEDDELIVTIQAKTSSKRIGGNQIVTMFKKRWKQIQAEYPKSVVTRKPERTIVNEFKAIRYSFRYRNFLNVVIDETTIWFNAERNETNLKSKIEVKGPAKSTKVEGPNIEGIIASFRFIAEKEKPTARTPDTVANNWTIPTKVDKQPTVQTATKNPVKTNYASASGSGSGDSTALTQKTHRVRKSRRKLNVNPAGLMANARAITDPEKLAKYQRTFKQRDTVRTAEQKAAARAYSGGFRSAEVE